MIYQLILMFTPIRTCNEPTHSWETDILHLLLLSRNLYIHPRRQHHWLAQEGVSRSSRTVYKGDNSSLEAHKHYCQRHSIRRITSGFVGYYLPSYLPSCLPSTLPSFNPTSYPAFNLGLNDHIQAYYTVSELILTFLAAMAPVICFTHLHTLCSSSFLYLYSTQVPFPVLLGKIRKKAVLPVFQYFFFFFFTFSPIIFSVLLCSSTFHSVPLSNAQHRFCLIVYILFATYPSLAYLAQSYTILLLLYPALWPVLLYVAIRCSVSVLLYLKHCLALPCFFASFVLLHLTFPCPDPPLLFALYPAFFLPCSAIPLPILPFPTLPLPLPLAYTDIKPGGLRIQNTLIYSHRLTLYSIMPLSLHCAFNMI